MNDENYKHELSDELLSAYLDNELAPEERAVIEARLANDPEAQQMLHQLRSVSQSVQRLPLESVGRDLSGEILRRAQALKPAPSGGAEDRPTPVGGSALPRMTIFQTRRSWFWASLALAAGLMIMFLQPADENEQELPAVAQRESARAPARQLDELSRSGGEAAAPLVGADAATLAREETVMAPASGPAISQGPTAESGLAMGTAATPSESSTISLGGPSAVGPGPPSAPIAESSGTLANAPPTGAVASSDANGAGVGGAMKQSTVALDKPAGIVSGAAAPAAPLADQVAQGTNRETLSFNGGKLATRSFGGPEGGGGASTPPPAAPASHLGLETQPESLVVVHLVAKPEAFANKTLDKLLAKRGIEVETVPAADTSELAASLGTRDGQLANRSSDDTTSTDQPAKRANEEVDFVLVDAPAQSVELFLSDLKSDATNYVGVEVESPAESGEAKSRVAKLSSQVPDLRQYSRGVVAPAQKDAWRYYYGDVTKAEQDKTEAARFDRSAGSAGTSRSAVPEQLAEQEKVVENRTRALRIAPSDAVRYQTDGARGRSEPAGRHVAEESRMLRRAQSELQTAGDASDRMQVLFVVSPEQAVAGAPAEKSAE